METLRVHIAELVIATDPQAADVTIADTVTKSAEARGLAIVAREVVGDVEALIRAKLEQFIADPNIDVVVATGVAESAAAGHALRPLVTSPVPGFTDLFRWLAYQEIGASAMLSNAEAALCNGTIVFILPAVKGAVEQAMEKLILPQLDPATQPKNLIQQIPRLASLVRRVPLLPPPPVADGHAVPQPIEAERTASGPGIPARLPSNPAIPIQRPASKTGPHVIRKADPDVTKQIGRVELERNLVRSESSAPNVPNVNDAVTKPSIDLRTLLPRVPPGADEIDDTDMASVLAGPPRSRPATQRLPRRPPTIQIPVKEGAPREVRKSPALTPQTSAPGEVVSLDAAELEPATDEEFAKRTQREDSKLAIPARALPRSATIPPPPPKKRAPTEPPPLFVSDKKQPPRPARTPTEPPRPRDTLNDLPRGKFVYPVQKGPSSKQIAMWLVFALLAAAAGVAFVHFFLTEKDRPRRAVVIADAASATPGDATEVASIEPDAAMIEPDTGMIEPDTGMIEVEVDVSAAALGSAARSQPTTRVAVLPKPHVDAGSVTGRTPGDDAGATGGAEHGSGSSSAPEDPSCDEVSCVLEQYARACCARWKPAEGFKPNLSGQSESLDKVMVKEGIEGVKPRVIACGEKYASKGTVKIVASVAPDGSVRATTVAEAPDPELGTCVARALRAATFAKTSKGGSFSYPFVF